METTNILHADVLDIIFDGKNKEYGAYELRKTYNKRLLTAVSAMSLVCLSLFLTSLLANDGDKAKKRIAVQDVRLTEVKEKKKDEPLPPPPPPKHEEVKVQVEKFTIPKIVVDEQVRPEDEIKAVEDLQDAVIGTMDVDGVKFDGTVAPPLEKSTGVVEAPKVIKEDFEKTFTKVEKEAAFPGGAAAWKNYLERNLNAQVASDDGAPSGNYAVKVQFIVDKDGNISNVTAVEVPKACPSCGPEAVKVIKRGPKWDPAIQNGTKVTYQAVQYITFQVEEN